MRIFSIFILSVITQSAIACTCMFGGEPRRTFVAQNFAEADIVILAQLDSKNEDIQERRTRLTKRVIKETVQETHFTTLKIFKGEIAAGFYTKMVVDGIGCNYYFRDTGKYILYFYKQANTNFYSTFKCQGTMPLRENVDDLEILEVLATNN